MNTTDETRIFYDWLISDKCPLKIEILEMVFVHIQNGYPISQAVMHSCYEWDIVPPRRFK